MSLNDWLTRRRLYTPDRVGVVNDVDGKRYSYAELDQRACRVAIHLQHVLGLKPGDRIACLSGNCLEYLDLYFACGKLGAVLLPLNTRLPTAAVIELLSDCQPSLLVYEAQFAQTAIAAQQAQVVPGVCCLDATDPETQHQSISRIVTRELAAEADVEVYRAEESDIAMILYTSGTTGRPKGAMISYRQIHWNALNTIVGLQLTQHDTTFLNMPLFHTGGWHVLFTPLMLIGGRLVLQRQFDAQRCNELLGPEGITILFGVPTTLQMMRDAPNFSRADFSTVRFAIFGGERCPLPVIEDFGGRGVAMRQGYGLTEAGPNCFSLPAEDAIRKQGSIGLPNFYVDVRLRKDDGAEADVGEVGELLMSGPHLFAGYWRDQEATDRALQRGWLATGDLMTRDEEGYYYVVGRTKDMFISGGENVYPAHVERVLQQHPAVAQAAVVGVPHAKWGEAGVAFVRLAPEQSLREADLLAWCRENLASFQCPTRIVCLEDLPIGDSGKVDKQKLGDLATEKNDG